MTFASVDVAGNVEATKSASLVITALPSSTTRYEQTDRLLSYGGPWVLSSAAFHSGGSYDYLDATGSVTAAFDGTGIGWVTTKDVIYGKATVSVDGEAPETVDLYSPTFKPAATVWSVAGLAPGQHTVTISWTGDRDPAALGTYIGVDAFDVAGSLVAMP